MTGDLAVLVADVSPYVTVAVSAYGGAVLGNVKDQTADATVRLGRRILQRIFGHHDEGEVPVVIAGLAAAPHDADRLAAVLAEIRGALAADPGLANDLRKIVAGHDASVTVIAGKGSTIFTGDARADASKGGIVFGQVGGSVRVTRSVEPPADPPAPGRSSH